MKTTALSLALILLTGTLVAPIGFSEAQSSDLIAPNPPTNLTATPVSNNQINLSWAAPVNSTLDQVNGYKIEISSHCSGSFGDLAANTTTTSTTYSNTGLIEGICYAYKVSAINPVGIGSPSNTAYATTWTVPNSPTSLTANAISSSQINLSWIAPTNTGGTPVTGYMIQKRDSCAGIFLTLVANTSNTSTTYSNTGLVNGTCYQYRVFAYNAVGTSMASNNATGTTLQNPTPSIYPPSTPIGVGVVVKSNTSLKLTWNSPSNTDGVSITGYQIQRNGTTIVNNTGNTQTSFTNIGLLPAHQQTYRVAAWNSAGLGSYSGNATGITTNQTGIIPTDINNLGQQVSSFVQYYKVIFKQQREDTIKVLKECNEKISNATPENKAKVKEDCKIALKTIKEKYKDVRKQFKNDFKVFRDTAKSLIKVAKEDKTIDREDVKGLKKDLKKFEKEAKKITKEFKADLKEIKKEKKHEEKENKKELKELEKEKKNKHDDEDDD
ncbi:MAG: Fibronectin type protein [Candidatus Nitrosotenuis sp.]|nr:Fibronectin type protein [Candidatus Nitrosotenuis sp.]